MAPDLVRSAPFFKFLMFAEYLPQVTSLEIFDSLGLLRPGTLYQLQKRLLLSLLKVWDSRIDSFI